MRHKETEPSRAKGTFIKKQSDVNRKEIQKGRVGKKKTLGEKEGQMERWEVLWREGVFMSGCHRHSGTPLKRRKFDIEREG